MTATSDAANVKDNTPTMRRDHGQSSDDNVSGPLASATMTRIVDDRPAARSVPGLSDRTRNNHHLTPQEVTIKAGGTVNFIISGFHHAVVYGPDTKPEDVSLAGDHPPRCRRSSMMRTPVSIAGSIRPRCSCRRSGHDNAASEHSGSRRGCLVSETGRVLVICGVIPHFFSAATGEFIMFASERAELKAGKR